MRYETERAVLLARYIVETGATVRSAAVAFGIGKSTVHSDVTKKLRRYDAALWARCREVLERNREERHLRGGDATRRKYAELRELKKLRGGRQQS
ncbi:MAG: sporulation transcriptional regulator SpoIIID [Oscillospiraceae bacterium]|nr:sporulation transcriptional regulator SpoIIID [Oscillospiraceae bacterium]